MKKLISHVFTFFNLIPTSWGRPLFFALVAFPPATLKIGLFRDWPNLCLSLRPPAILSYRRKFCSTKAEMNMTEENGEIDILLEITLE